MSTSKSGSKRGHKKQKAKAANHGGRLFEVFRPIASKGVSSLKDRFRGDKVRVICGVILIALSIWLIAATLSYVRTGFADQSITEGVRHGMEERAEASNMLSTLGAQAGSWLFGDLFGWGAFFLLGFMLYGGVFLIWLRYKGLGHLCGSFVALGFFAVWVSIAMAFVQRLVSPEGELLWGGTHGRELTEYGIYLIGSWGLVLALVTTLVIAAIMISDRFLYAIKNPKLPQKMAMPDLDNTKERVEGLGQWLRNAFFTSEQEEDGDVEEMEDEAQGEEEYTGGTDAGDAPGVVPKPEPRGVVSPQSREVATSSDGNDLIVEEAPKDDLVDVPAVRPEGLSPGLQYARYNKPSIDLLNDYEQGAKPQDREEIERNKQRIIDTLASFKIPVKPFKATIGPTVTLYEVIPEQGIKVSRIKNMEDDIILNLSIETARIIAPLPGKGTVGIEVPNSTPQTVSMRTILASRKYNDLLATMELPVGIGKTITNEPFVFDLAKMPHLLIAGATGQGKSVGLNAMITSLLYSKRPEEMKLILIDPKMLEFSVYEALERHFMAKLPDMDKAIVTDMTKVVPTLLSLCIEMDNRYRLLADAGVLNIFEYNRQVRSGVNVALNKGELMPYIVLIVDEFADLIMTSGKEVEQPIARLAQKARAAGIHMVIATQRPSTDVITGLIKSNFPARIAFKVFSGVDSKVILDSTGANQLVGRGDMLFYQGRDMLRIQCAFLDRPETEEIVRHIALQEGPTAAYELPEYVTDSDGEGKSFNPREKDPLFDDVARLVVSSGVGSTSNIQRKFNIGYNRAGRLMDQLEGAGIVSPQDGSKPREVYVKDIDALEQLLHSLK